MRFESLVRSCALITLVAAFGFVSATSLAAPKFQGVFMAGNYPGGAAFDDFLEPSANALAFNMSLWSNWDIVGPNKNIDVLTGTTQLGISDSQRYIDAMAPYQAGGAKQLNAGDYFYLLYFGHGTYGTRLGTLPGEVAPALSVWDEALSFPDHTALTDDELKTEFGKFAVVLDGIEKNLNTATSKIQDAGRKTRSIERKLKGVEALPRGKALTLLEDGADSEADSSAEAEQHIE